ncbi:unnamed protein product [marine sediment metagenome]|uniref:Uncharacterized protein n=1 Tax=marine sediment metagenome TaxID=412755 RepID=X0SC96_9ZZZZ
MGICATTTNIIPNLPGLPQTDTSSGYTATVALVDRHLTRAENLVNGTIGVRYEVPFSQGACPPMLTTIVEDIVSYYTLRSFFSKDNQNENDYTDEFKDAVEQLKAIRDGDVSLVSTTGSLTPERPVTEDLDLSSNVTDKQSFFDKDEPTSWHFDEDLLDDIRGNR